MADVFRWTPESELAAELVAAGELTQDAIADRVGVVRSTLWLWRKHPEFAARVAENLESIRAEIRRVGIAIRENRVRALNDRWERMQRVIAERAADLRMEGVAGGTTGLLAHNVKGVGKGEDFQLVHLYEVDTGLLREIREVEKQAAIELGQWSEKTEQSGGVAIRVEYQSLDVTEAAPGPAVGTEPGDPL